MTAAPVAQTTTSFPVGTGFIIDRHLCTSTHLYEGFARYVLAEIAAPSLRASGPSPGVDLVALARHALLADRRLRALHVRLAVLLAGVICLLAPAVASWPEAGVAGLVAPVLGAWACAVVIVVVHRVGTYRMVQRIRHGSTPVRDLAPEASPDLESRLTSGMTANAVVFSGGVPFIGAGQLLNSWQVSLNCQRPAPGRVGSTGGPAQVTPFTAAALHKRLTVAARQTGIPGLRVRNRLFVDGFAAAAVPGLLPDPQDRAAPTVSTAALRAGIDQPRPTARTYLCLEKVSWGGDLVVSTFVRVERTAGYLSVEGHAFALLPLRGELCVAEHLPSTIVARSVLRSVRSAGPWLLGSPLALARNLLRGAEQDRALARQRRMVRRQAAFDYGARTGIREQAASPERVHLFAHTDEERDLTILRQAILEAVFEFLDAHGVDTSDFTRQQTNIVNHSISIGSVIGGSHVIGGGTVNNQPGAPSGPPAAPAVTPAPWGSTAP